MFRATRTNYILIFVFVLLAFYPFFFDSFSIMLLLSQIFILAAFAMSYDILLGFTGIVSFGHAMFFGIGAYTTGIIIREYQASFLTIVLSLITAMVLAAIVSFIAGILSLRLKTHFYAMLTLALAQLFLVGAEKWRSLTAGNDGFTFFLPVWLMDPIHFYFVALVFMIIIYFLLYRFTQSPVGRVLQAIRENENRVESLGYKVLYYKVTANIVSGVVAALSGAMYAYTLHFVSTSVFSIDQTLDVLLMTIIGGVGTLVGAMLGAGLIELVHHWLTQLADVFWLFERWIILFGIIYILAVMFFPQGIVGGLYKLGNKWEQKKHSNKQTAVKQEETKGA
ncbi:MAG: branched-chain amino acid ABC transporter permease [Tuberibacillus sp.]